MQNIPQTGAVDYIDPRTVTLQEATGTTGSRAIPSFYETEYKFPIANQKQQQACPAFAAARQLEIWEMKQGKPYRRISEAFFWVLCKVDDGLPISKGTFNIQPFKVANKYGYVYSDEWNKSTDLPPEEYAKNDIPDDIMKLAATRKMSYGGVSTSDTQAWNEAIYTFGATTCPIQLSQDWWTVNGAYNYDVPDPIRPPKYPIDYGHSMLAIGYDQGVEKKVVNSWGELWSRDGKTLFSTLDYKPHSTAYFFIGKINDIQIPVLPKITEYNFDVNTTLRYKQKSDNVRQLQIALRLLGFLTSDEFLTGYYGDQTKAAVYKFQFQYMQKYLSEIQVLKGEQVGAKTLAELKNQLSILKKKALQTNSGSDVPYWLQSSQDPDQVSLRIKAILLGILPAGILLASLFGYKINQEQAIQVITAIATVVSAGVYLYGQIRAWKNENTI